MIFLLAAIGPFGLMLVLKLLPLGILLEEVFKGGLVIWLVSRGNRVTMFTAFAIGATYGFSEFVLFDLAYWSTGNYLSSIWRLLLTTPMHGLTGVCWLWGIRRKRIWLGGLTALAVHGLFNFLTGLWI